MLFYLLLLLPLVSSQQSHTAATRIQSHVKNADAHYPPINQGENRFVHVTVSLLINRISWDGPKGTEVDLYLRQDWPDSRLAFGNLEPSVAEYVIPDEDTVIWMPDTTITTGRERAVRSQRQRIVIEKEGHVRASEERELTLTPNTVSSSPFWSTRSLTIQLTSYKYQTDALIYTWANNPPKHPIEVNPGLLEGEVYIDTFTADHCPGNYTLGMNSCLEATITFRTSFWKSFTRFFLPSTLLVIFSWLHMWLHASWSVPRSLSAILPFVILASVFLFTPPASHNACWLFFCLLFAFISLLEYFLVLCSGVTSRTTSKLPTYHDDRGNSPVNNVTVTTTESVSKLDAIARIAFPALFLLCALLFVFLF